MFNLRTSVFFIAMLLCSFLALAQQPVFTPKEGGQSKAIGITDNSMFDQLMVTVVGVGSHSRLTQELQTLKPYMMPVRKLGHRGNDWSYALAGCLEYYVNLTRNFKDNLSPDYIALGVQTSGQRPGLKQGLDFLTQQGTVSAAIVPYDAAQIPSTVYATKKIRINNFLHLFQPFASSREKTFEIRKALMRGNPVIVEIQASASFPQMKGVLSWTPNKSDTNKGYTLVIVGFDETQQAFELMGCWGNDWANNGYVWMKYSDLSQAAINGYVMLPNAY